MPNSSTAILAKRGGARLIIAHLRGPARRTRSPRRWAIDVNVPQKGKAVLPCDTAALVSSSDARGSVPLLNGSGVKGGDSGLLSGAGSEAFRPRSANLGVPPQEIRERRRTGAIERNSGRNV
jgi:hypothetical protein